MEIIKNLILAVHIIGVVALLGGVVYQIKAWRAGTARILAPMMHGAWTMLVTGIILVGMQYPLGNDVNNTKISVKLIVLLAIVAIAFIHRKRETLSSWVLPALGLLTIANTIIATTWK
ncbi:hypothetical protein [Demequina globuliformis]|uniref:hypothetical protein n=1 Tax=Demequina globuliformis TaxID=676202 RepID=UPI0007828985|nr:hypothetical protein [Demequina globuliformis]